MPVLDSRIAHIWQWFVDLDASRASGGFGPSPITYSDIAAYQAVTREVIEPWEARAIRSIDDAILSASAKKASANGGTVASASDPAAVAALMTTMKGKTT